MPDLKNIKGKRTSLNKRFSAKGMFDNLEEQEQEQKERKNPFSGIFDSAEQGTLIDSSRYSDLGESRYSKRKRIGTEAEEAAIKASKAGSLKTTAWKTLTGLPRGAFDIAKQVIQDPKESARQAALGIADGISLGATSYLERKAFVDEAKKYGMDEVTAESMAEKILKPDDSELGAIRGGSHFAGIVVPYAAAEVALIKGLKYAAPNFVSQYGKTAKLLADIGVFNAVGQTEESFKPADERDRKTRALIDTAAAGAFFTGGEIFRRIRGTKFKTPFSTTPVSGAKPASEKEVLTNTREHLLLQVSHSDKKAGAILEKIDINNINTLDDLARVYKDALPKEMQTKPVLSSIDNWIASGHQKVAFYSKQAAKPTDTGLLTGKEGALKSIFEEGKVYTEKELAKLRGGANTSVTIKTGVKEGEKAVGKDLTVITNDLESLQGYIKGSGDIEFKSIATLGKDSAGNKVMARHEFNPSTGKHIIYATDEATASTMAHELGHYFDKKLTQTTLGLSNVLPNFKKNQEAIEDVLGSLAVQRLGGKATGKQISSEISTISKSIIKEAEALSKARGKGAAAETPSEQFADAISEILTRKGAREKAPILTELLQHSQKLNEAEVFGEAVAKKITSKKFEKEAAEEVVEKVVKEKAPAKKIPTRPTEGVVVTKDIKQKGRGKRPIKKDEKVFPISSTEKSMTFQTVTGKEFTVKATKVKSLDDVLKETFEGDAPKILKDFKGVQKKAAGEIIGEKQIVKDLERTKTGKKPTTEAIRAEKITADAEAEVFINTKVLPKITGKERVGKSNQDILERSLASKMTEKDFNEILNTRFGNLAEDVVKAKRMMNDRILEIRTKLAQKDVDSLTGEELKVLMEEYNQLTEMFEVFAGVRTELSSSFRSLGIEVVPGENDVLRETVRIMQKTLGKEGDDFAFMTKALKLRENDIVDTYFNIWYPAVLSGPKTTVRNIVGTGANLFTETASTLFTKQGRQEFLPRILALADGQKKAWNKAGDVMKKKTEVISKFDEASALRKADFEKYFGGKIAWLNEIEFVGRFLNAQDIFFSTIAHEGEIAAMRAGKFTYGIQDKAVIESLDKSVAHAYGQRTTYRNPYENTLVSEIGRVVTAAKMSENKFLKAGATMVFPFVKTVANVTERKIDYVPILNLWRSIGNKNYAVRAKRIVADAGVTGKEATRIQSIIEQRLKHQQMGKMYMGLTVMATMTPLAVAGRITGSGPKSKKERDTLMLKGWRPNSIILPGGVVLPYMFLGPLAGVFSVLGNISDGIKYNNDDDKAIAELLGEGLRAIMQTELDQSFMAGLSNINDLINGYKSFNESVADLASNTLIPVPAVWTQTKDIIFPERFESNTFWENIQNKIGITGGLQPRLDTFGQQVGSDLIWGLTPKVMNTNDPVINWMDDNDVFVGKPNRKQTITQRGEKREYIYINSLFY